MGGILGGEPRQTHRPRLLRSAAVPNPTMGPQNYPTAQATRMCIGAIRVYEDLYSLLGKQRHWGLANAAW